MTSSKTQIIDQPADSLAKSPTQPTENLVVGADQLPSYTDLFGAIDKAEGYEARSVLSPAAYLVDLLQLQDNLEGSVSDTGANGYHARRPDVGTVPLDDVNTFGEVPYLDVANEVMKSLAEPDGTGGVHATLAARLFPSPLPFTIDHERLKLYLEKLGTSLGESYRRYQPEVDGQQAARLHLGLSVAEHQLFTTARENDQQVAELWGVDHPVAPSPALPQPGLSDLRAGDVTLLKKKLGLSLKELKDLLYQDLSEDEIAAAAGAGFFINQDPTHPGTYLTLQANGTVRLSDGSALTNRHLDRLMRFVRLARRLQLGFGELDWILQSACANTLDAGTLQAIAVALTVRARYGLPVEEICCFWAPPKRHGRGDGPEPRDLFHRIFNRGYPVGIETVAQGGFTEALKNRLLAALRTSRADYEFLSGALTARGTPPEPTVGYFAVLYRLVALARMLALSVQELFLLLDVLDAQASTADHEELSVLFPYAAASDTASAKTTFQALVIPEDRPNSTLAGLQKVLRIKEWLDERQLSVRHLAYICLEQAPGSAQLEGVALDDDIESALGEIHQTLQGMLLQPGVLQTGSLTPRGAQAAFDLLSRAGALFVTKDSEPTAPKALLRRQPSQPELLAAVQVGVDERLEVYSSDFTTAGVAPANVPALLGLLIERGYLEQDGERHLVSAGSRSFFLEPANLPHFFLPEVAERQEAIFGMLAEKCRAFMTGKESVSREAEELGTRFFSLAEQHARHVQRILAAQLALAEDLTGVLYRFVFGTPDETETQAIAGLTVPLFDIKGQGSAGSRVLASASLALRFKRLRQFALLARKVGLSAQETQVYFDNQRVHRALPEPLKLSANLLGAPASLTALTSMPSGDILVVSGDRHARFSGQDYRLLGGGGLDKIPGLPLPPSFTAAIDCAWTDKNDVTYVCAGEQYISSAEPSSPKRIADKWGRVRNHIQDKKRVDAAFQDEKGRVYLFCGDQYVRYSDPQGVLVGDSFVDEGYPKSIRLGFADEQVALLPSLMNARVDAAFRDADGSYYFFSGDKFTHSKNPYDLRVIRSRWGRVHNRLFDENRVDAAFVSGDHTYLVRGDQIVRYTGGEYGFVDERYPIAFTHIPDSDSRLRILKRFPAGVEAALTGRDGTLHVFGGGVHVSSASPEVSQVIRERWGRVRNHFVDSGRVDAAFFHQGKAYLFSGDQYIRYSTADYSHVDEGYPKRVRSNWNQLEGIGLLPDQLPEPISAVAVEKTGQAYFFAGNQFAGPDGHLGSIKQSWAQVRNNIQRLGRVDAAMVDGQGRLFLFSGDQLYRYSSPGGVFADEGYPRRLSSAGSQQGEGWTLPETFGNGISAALRASDGRTFFFSGDRYARVDAASAPQAIRQDWGGVRNWISTHSQVDAGFVDSQGRTFLFGGDQFVRYSQSSAEFVDEGYPLAIAARWGNLPADFRNGIDAAFLFTVDGVQRLFLFKGGDYVRYSTQDYTRVDEGYPKHIVDGKQIEGQWFRGLAVHKPNDRSSHEEYITLAATYVDSYLGQPRLVVIYYHPSGDQWKREYRIQSGGRYDWTEPQAVQNLTEYRPFTRIDSAFVAPDGTLHVFSGEACASRPPQGGALSTPVPTRDRWGRVLNQLAQLGRVDASLVTNDGRTYLFCEEQFVRYSGALRPGDANFFVDEGYPRRIAQSWNAEGVSIALPPRLQAEGDALCRDGDGQLHLFNQARYVRSGAPGTQESVAARWGRVENRFHELDRVDAAYRAENDKLYLFCDDQYVRYSGALRPGASDFHVDEGYPRQIATSWAAEGTAGSMPARFTALGSAILKDAQQTFFFAGSTFTSSQSPEPRPVIEHWAKVRNVIQARNRVDAGFTLEQGHGAVTFLFSGDQYFRYSGVDDGFVDEGYPKRLALMAEVEGVPPLPAELHTGVRAAFAGRDGRLHWFSPAQEGEPQVYVSSAEPATVLPPRAKWGIVDNKLYDQSFVNAALLASGGKLYLFSGDQYVRYSGTSQDHVDEGYPRRVVPGWAEEIQAAGLPPIMASGVDAALALGGTTYYFMGDQYVASTSLGTPQPLAERWGKVDNRIQEKSRIDAAFVAPSGKLYLFTGDQYAVYSGTSREYVDEGFPRKIVSDLGQHWPADFRQNLDSACSFEGRTYLFKGTEHVRFSDPFLQKPDSGYPMAITEKFVSRPDFELGALPEYWGFKTLSDTYSAPPRTLLKYLTGDTHGEAELAATTGWAASEVEYLLGQPSLPGSGLGDSRTLNALSRHFAFADRLGATPSTLKVQLWNKVYGPGSTDLAAAADLVYSLVKARTSTLDWPEVARAFQNSLNLATRDALTAYLVDAHKLGNADDLYELLLTDVRMGATATTSRIVEAIASVQLYYHRALMNLETVPAEVRAKLQHWWSWMKNYRIWEANRRVFLHPENYIRPELRPLKSPAFKELEQNLLQDQITAESVEAAYTAYLEKFTEVSRLRIAGGYVYRDGAGDSYILMLGFARTEPLTYYHRFGRLPDDPAEPIAWQPWEKLDITINAERVRPVYTFNRLFLFWFEQEPAKDAPPAPPPNQSRFPAGDPALSDPGSRGKPTIRYSFYNLSGKWVQPQSLKAELLRADGGKSWPTSEVAQARLYVTNPSFSAEYDPNAYNYVLLSIPGISDKLVGRMTAALDFEPRPSIPNADATDLTSSIDLEAPFPSRLGITPDSATQWGSHFRGIMTSPWFSFEASGGSFLCRPHEPTPISQGAVEPEIKLRGQTFAQVDAGFSCANGDLFVFSTENGRLLYRRHGTTGGSGGERTWEPPVYMDEALSGSGQTWPWGRQQGLFDRYPERRIQNVVVAGAKTYFSTGTHHFTYSGNDYRWTEQRYSTECIPGEPPLDALVEGALRLDDWKKAFQDQRQLVRAFRHGSELVLVTRTSEGGLEYGEVSLTQLRDHLDSEEKTRGFLNGWERIDTVFTTVQGTDLSVTLTSERNLLTLRWTGMEWSAGDLGRYHVAEPRLSAAFTGADGKLYFVCDDRFAEVNGTPSPQFHPVAGKWGRFPPLFSTILQTIDAALMAPNGTLYLFSGEYCLRYPGFDPSHLSALVLPDEAPALSSEVFPGFTRVTSAFMLESKVYLFDSSLGAPARYARYSLTASGAGFVLEPGFPKRLQGEWGNLPKSFNLGFDAAIEVKDETGGPGPLYLMRGSSTVSYGGTTARTLYEIGEVSYSIIRLTSNTAEPLSQKLLDGGISKLLDLQTQATIEELPRFSTTAGRRQDEVKYSSTRYLADYPKAALGLDFQSANGFYYWETFFHIPYLIAQALNQAQRFIDAKEWYEYVFDPTEALSTGRRFWKFLPFHVSTDGNDSSYLEDPDQLRRYQNDPFDPHGLAQLRQIAYRKALVMAYIDNLLDWGDALFQQYTRESIGEATMLYVLAADLLGKPPEESGKRKLEAPTTTYNELCPDESLHPDLIELENLVPSQGFNGAALAGSTPNDSMLSLSSYFFIPENQQFIDYWARVADRLGKIRSSLDIEGVARSLALFEPPVDVMAMVNALAGGGGVAQLQADRNAAVPHYRFLFMLAKARELAGRLMQLGGELLATLEKQDAEELNLLRNTQERAILEMTLEIKQQQLEHARHSVSALRAGLQGAETRRDHYQRLLTEGLSSHERLQVGMMILGHGFAIASTQASVNASIASSWPTISANVHIQSPFALGPSLGLSWGGSNVGASRTADAQGLRGIADSFNFISSLSATLGAWDRRRQEWELQRDLSRYDIEQIGRQIAAAEIQVDIARKEIQVHRRQIRHNQSVETFMKSKFTNRQLYQWMAGKLSAVYFQTYQMALDYAKAAQRALQFEMGWAESEAQHIGSYYWDSLRKGLLAGEQLQLDLDRLEKAHLEKNKRRFEVTKTVSLMQVDPLAFLRLKQKGTCEFELSEALFDQDFPGHYCRQIKTVSVSFPAILGPYDNFNATMTQLSHRTVLKPEVGAVKYLLTAEGEQPLSIRSDWRPNQQVALSRGVNDSGLFQLNYQDERYLPFEGTGAVSRWRLEINGAEGTARREHLSDVIVTIQYTAIPGGDDFAEKVKSALPPAGKARMLNLAYDFPQAWQAFLLDPARGLSFTVERAHLPGSGQSAVSGIYLLYELTETGASAIGRQALRLNGSIELTPGSLRDELNLSIGSWKLVPTGRLDKFRPENIKNIALVITYTSKPTF